MHGERAPSHDPVEAAPTQRFPGGGGGEGLLGPAHRADELRRLLQQIEPAREVLRHEARRPAGGNNRLVRREGGQEALRDAEDELVTLSRDQDLARSAIKRLCHLYRSDVACFPYDVSECHGTGM